MGLLPALRWSRGDCVCPQVWGGPLATRKLRRTLPSRERRSVQAPVCPPRGPGGMEYRLPGLRWEQRHSWQNPNRPPWGWRDSHSWRRWALEGGDRTSVSSEFPQVEKQVSLNGRPAKVTWWLGAEAGPAQQVLLTLLPSNHPIGTHTLEAVPSVFTKKCPQSEAQCRQGWGQEPSVDCPEEQVPALGAWGARGVPLPHQWTEISIRNELDCRTPNGCRRTVVGTNSPATIWKQTLGRWACAAPGLQQTCGLGKPFGWVRRGHAQPGEGAGGHLGDRPSAITLTKDHGIRNFPSVPSTNIYQVSAIGWVLC